MDRLRPASVTALVAWTLFTWGNRIPLLWSDDAQSTAAKVAGSVPIAAFVALALATLVAMLRSGSHLAGAARGLAIALAVWSIGYWAVRLPLIVVHDHTVPFKVVHTVLAAVAVGLAAWVLADVRRVPAAGADSRPPVTAAR